MKAKVTSFVGVWIETRCFIVEVNGVQVTSFVGVWIETVFLKYHLPY